MRTTLMAMTLTSLTFTSTALNTAFAGEDEIAPRWSQDGSYIYFYSYRHPDPEQVHEIPSVTMKMHADGTRKAILSDGSSRNWWIVPKPCKPGTCGETDLYIISERDAKEPFGGSNLYQFDPVQDTYQPMTNADPADGQWILEASLSADGRYIGYIRREGFRSFDTSKYYVLDIHKNEHIQIPLAQTTLREAFIMPDGSGVVYSSTNKEILHHDFQSGATNSVFQVEHPEGKVAGGIAVSPDGSKVAFGYTESDFSGSDIYILDTSSGDLERLTNNNIPELRPAWHPDGTHVAFNRMHSMEKDWNDIIVYSLHDRSERNLTNNWFGFLR